MSTVLCLFVAESRYLVAGNTLLIREVSAADAGAYSCLARHALTAHTKRSRPAHLAVTRGSPSRRHARHFSPTLSYPPSNGGHTYIL
jgi:hypothetical protein